MYRNKFSHKPKKNNVTDERRNSKANTQMEADGKSEIKKEGTRETD